MLYCVSQPPSSYTDKTRSANLFVAAEHSTRRRCRCVRFENNEGARCSSSPCKCDSTPKIKSTPGRETGKTGGKFYVLVRLRLQGGLVRYYWKTSFFSSTRHREARANSSIVHMSPTVRRRVGTRNIIMQCILKVIVYTLRSMCFETTRWQNGKKKKRKRIVGRYLQNHRLATACEMLVSVLFYIYILLWLTRLAMFASTTILY